ncbi:endonuclease/exonuclease/phosphatase family protein [Streptomyces sp. NPDC020965]|uniref:endonuclease/exonuclease/phosphatase family protein n=1 Tax=Streptomyces sp. NPDC020965 TaxID=3365105 RepID=UPI0037896773
MRRFLSALTAVCALIAGLTVLSAPAARATATDGIASSAGQKWALKSLAPNTLKYVSIAADGRMAAVSAQVGPAETFTLHTNQKAGTIGLRSDLRELFATAEFGYTTDNGAMRVRGTSLGQWQQFVPTYSAAPAGSRPGSFTVTLRSAAVDHATKYISVNAAAGGDGRLRARVVTVPVGSWERFLLEPLAAPGAPPAADSPVAAADLRTMTWNVCANNTKCGWDPQGLVHKGLAGETELVAEIQGRLRHSPSDELPDVVFLQEFCEKHAAPVERMLEQATGRGWSVRFAPINQRMIDAVGAPSGPLVQKQCAMIGPEKQDRGAYGVALAVPAENVWYQRYDLVSPLPTVGKEELEQRTALCAALPARALQVCSTHFSAGDDDAQGSVRTQQALDLMAHMNKAGPGYRTVFGGDLNLVPPHPSADVGNGGPSTALIPVYDAYRECEQLNNPNALRAGRATANFTATPPKLPTPMKLDYLFGPSNADFRDCQVSASTGKSDHATLYGTVALPAV